MMTTSRLRKDTFGEKQQHKFVTFSRATNTNKSPKTSTGCWNTQDVFFQLKCKCRFHWYKRWMISFHLTSSRDVKLIKCLRKSCTRCRTNLVMYISFPLEHTQITMLQPIILKSLTTWCTTCWVSENAANRNIVFFVWMISTKPDSKNLTLF